MGRKSSAKKQRRTNQMLNDVKWDDLVELRSEVLNLIMTSKKVIDDTFNILKDDIKRSKDVVSVLEGSYRTLHDFLERCKQTSLLHMEEKDGTYVCKYLGPCVGEDTFKCMEIMSIYVTLMEQIKDVVSKVTIELTTSNGMENEVASKIIKIKDETEATINYINNNMVATAQEFGNSQSDVSNVLADNVVTVDNGEK